MCLCMCHKGHVHCGGWFVDIFALFATLGGRMRCFQYILFECRLLGDTPNTVCECMLQMYFVFHE